MRSSPVTFTKDTACRNPWSVTSHGAGTLEDEEDAWLVAVEVAPADEDTAMADDAGGAMEDAITMDDGGNALAELEPSRTKEDGDAREEAPAVDDATLLLEPRPLLDAPKEVAAMDVAAPEEAITPDEARWELDVRDVGWLLDKDVGNPWLLAVS